MIGMAQRAAASLGEQVLRHPAAAALVIVPLALGFGSLAGFSAGRAALPGESRAESYQEARAQTVAAHLRQFTGDYVLAAGDSHIEHWFASTRCGLPVVNAGVSGATAMSYRRFFSALKLKRPPRAVVLTIGTNDASVRRVGDPETATRRFAVSLRGLLETIGRRAPLVLLTAVPPPGPGQDKAFSTEAAARFSIEAKAACAAGLCRFVDPFGPGLNLIDGVHFENYRDVYDGLDSQLCEGMQPPPER